MKVSTFPSISFSPLQMRLVCPYVVSSFSLLPLLPHFPISLFSLSPTVYFPFSSILPPDTHTSFTSASATLLITLHWPYCWKNALTVTKAQNILKQCTHTVLLNSLTWDDTGCECAQIYFPPVFLVVVVVVFVVLYTMHIFCLISSYM